MERIILGDGISGYIIAACLEYKCLDFVIYGSGIYKAPPLLLLKYKSEEELKKYFEIFRIDYNSSNINFYTKHIYIGYINDYEIVDSPTQEMIDTYNKKLNRSEVESGMSDGLNEFDAIDLTKVYILLKERFKSKHIKIELSKEDIEKFKNRDDCVIYNTIIPTELNNNKPSYEYIKDFPLVWSSEYTYLYDCRDNECKRYTDNSSELIKCSDSNCIKIKNYYYSPMIYCTTNIKKKGYNIWYDISRNATKTQLKVEDIIKYILYYYGE